MEQGATSAVMVDTLAPNKKYYYTFRVVDVHNQVSLPSAIFEVELRKDREGMMPYLIQNLYKFPETKEDTSKKTFKKFLQIKPSILQTELPGLIDGDYNFAQWKSGGKKLGTTDNPIWGKTILYRIKSRATGKMVEVRVKFNRKHGKMDTNGIIEFED